jgi:hypothetical protein
MPAASGRIRPHPADYGSRCPADLRIWKDVDTATQQLIAYHTHIQWQAQERTIWMDGRPHPPPDAPTPGKAFPPAGGTATC